MGLTHMEMFPRQTRPCSCPSETHVPFMFAQRALYLMLILLSMRSAISLYKLDKQRRWRQGDGEGCAVNNLPCGFCSQASWVLGSGAPVSGSQVGWARGQPGEQIGRCESQEVVARALILSNLRGRQAGCPRSQ